MESTINKSKLSETDIITKFILPAIKGAGWDDMSQIRKRSPRYLDLPCLKKHVQFIDQKRSGTVSSQRLT
jgi:type I site-specific restriction endonuclease